MVGDCLPEKKINRCTLTKQSKISQHEHKRFLSEKELKQVIIAITCLRKCPGSGVVLDCIDS